MGASVGELGSDAVADAAVAELCFFLWLQSRVMSIDVFDTAIGLCHQALGLLQSALLTKAIAGDFEGVHGLNSTVPTPPLLGVERTAALRGLNVPIAYAISVAVATEMAIDRWRLVRPSLSALSQVACVVVFR